MIPMKLTSINFSHFFIKDFTEKIILYLHVSKQTAVEIKRKNISSLLKGSACNRKVAAFDHSATTFLTLVFPTSWGIRPESTESI
jgi:hypothetical protein